MSETTNSKESVSKWSISMRLHFNNLQQWIEHLFKEISQTEKIDRIMFFKTEEEWVPKKRTATTIMDRVEDEDGTNKKLLEKLNQRLQLKTIEEIEYVKGHLHPRIANVMMKWISPQVEQALENHPKYKTWAGEIEPDQENEDVYAYGAREDPLALLRMLIDVTRRQRFVHNLVFQSNDVVKMRTERDTFAMRAGESYADYELRWSRLKKDLLLSGIAPFEKVQQVSGEMQEVIVLFRGMRPNHPAKTHLQKLFKESINNPDAFPKTITELTKTVLDLELTSDFEQPGSNTTTKKLSEKQPGKQIQFGNIAKMNHVNNKPGQQPKPFHKYDPGQGMSTDTMCFKVTRIKESSRSGSGKTRNETNESTQHLEEPDEDYEDMPELIPEWDSDEQESSDDEAELYMAEEQPWQERATFPTREGRLPLPPSRLRMMAELEHSNNHAEFNRLPEDGIKQPMEKKKEIDDGSISGLSEASNFTGWNSESVYIPRSPTVESLSLQSIDNDSIHTIEVQQGTVPMNEDLTDDEDPRDACESYSPIPPLCSPTISVNQENSTATYYNCEEQDAETTKNQWHEFWAEYDIGRESLSDDGMKIHNKLANCTCSIAVMRGQRKRRRTVEQSTAEPQYTVLMTTDDTPPTSEPMIPDPNFELRYIDSNTVVIKPSSLLCFQANKTIASVGDGLFTGEDTHCVIHQGQPIGNFFGNRIPYSELIRMPRYMREYAIAIGDDSILDCYNTCMHPDTPHAMRICAKANCPVNLYRPDSLNRMTATDANAKAVTILENGEAYVLLYATRRIEPGEEILWVYRDDLDSSDSASKDEDEDEEDADSNSDPPSDDPPDYSRPTVDVCTLGAQVVNASNVNALSNASCYVNSFSSLDKIDKSHKNITILIDCAAGCSLFKNRELLTDIRKNETPIGVRGVNRNAPILVKQAGFFLSFGLVAVCTHLPENIISMAEMIDRGHRISYYTKTDTFVMTATNGDIMKFTRHGRHYKYVIPITVDSYPSATYAQTDTNIPGTVEQRAAIYPKKAIQRAIAARRLQARLGYPTSPDFASMKIQNADITPRDVAIADHVFGPPIATLKGRTTKRASPPIVPSEPVVIEANQTLEIDVMFVNHLPFLVGILVPLGYSFVDYVPNRKEKEIHQSLFKFINKTTARRITITHVVSDNEGSAHTAETKLNSMSIQLSTTAAGEKVHRVERRIRFIKERVRSIVHALPYRLCAKLLAYCVYYANWCTNNHRMAASTHNRTPHEQFTGRNLNATRDLRHAFGDFVQATVPHTNNSMQPRTEACIALIHSGSLTGGVVMYCVKTSQIVVRDQFRIIPAPSSLITHLNSLATRDGMPEQDVTVDDTPDTIPLPPPPSLVGVDTSSLTIPVDTEWRGEKTKATRASKKLQEEGKRIANELEIQQQESLTVKHAKEEKDNNLRTQNPQTKGIDITLHEDSSEEEDRTEKYHDNDTEEMYWKEIDAYMTETIEKGDTLIADVLNISVKKAMKTHGETAEQSMTKEIRQIWEKNAWTPVMRRDIPHEDKNRIIRSFMFLKEKYTAEGVMDKLKSRLVANGKQQDRELYDNLASPTAALMSLFIVAAIAAYENRKTATVDIGGAFLHARPKAENPIYVVLDKVMSEIMVKIDSKYGQYCEKNGEITVRLDKALYGCVESALLWYNHISGALADLGFVKNPCDSCVFNMISKGVQCTIVLHVDDLFVTCVDESVIDEVLRSLKERYSETNESRGNKHNYLGMVFDLSNADKCVVSMPGYEKALFEDGKTYRRAPTPARDNLFETDAESEKLNASEMKEFHTKVAKLLYLAKRTRPECLVAVSYLTTRVTKSTVQDRAKLHRVLGYLGETEGASIEFRPGEKGIVLEQYVDASYGVHIDGKSHTGSVINLGEFGAVFCGSKKQGIVTKSSTECELVALSDSAGQLIHAREFVMHQGHEQARPTEVYQDNMSTMALVKAGRPGNERSRHINIRHFWVKEKVDEGVLKITHMPTKMMVANLLTKPLQGAQFRFEVKLLTNSAHVEHMNEEYDWIHNPREKETETMRVEELEASNGGH